MTIWRRYSRRFTQPPINSEYLFCQSQLLMIGLRSKVFEVPECRSDISKLAKSNQKLRSCNWSLVEKRTVSISKLRRVRIGHEKKWELLFKQMKQYLLSELIKSVRRFIFGFSKNLVQFVSMIRYLLTYLNHCSSSVIRYFIVVYI